MEEQSGLALAKLVAQKQVSPEELVKDAIERIERLNPALNAVVSTRYEKALHEAKTRDFSQKIFGGVPLLLKDLGQQLKGEKNTSGAKLLEHYYSVQTDYLVQAFENLGFIILGQTATCEFGFKNYTASELYGVTCNPLDISRHVGGSSGGAASAVASGMLPIAAASDGGGSIRIPASWTGLYGLKPSRGRIPVGPSSYRGWQGAAVNFAVTKTLEDTKALFYSLQVEQWDSPFTLPKNSPQPLKRPFRIAYSVQSPIGTTVSREAKETVYQIVKHLENLGHHIEEKMPDLDGVALMRGYYVMNSVETASMFQSMEQVSGRRIDKDDMEVMSYLIYEMGKHVPAWRYSQLLGEWDKAAAIMHQFHQTYDVLITPTTADIAPKIADYGVPKGLNTIAENINDCSQEEKEQIVWDMFLEGLTLTPFTQQANLTGQPALSIPYYTTSNGMPIGIQITAAKGREDFILAVATSVAYG